MYLIISDSSQKSSFYIAFQCVRLFAVLNDQTLQLYLTDIFLILSFPDLTTDKYKTFFPDNQLQTLTPGNPIIYTFYSHIFNFPKKFILKTDKLSLNIKCA